MGAIRSKGTWFHAKHNRLRFQLGSYNKATVAIANRLARVIYHIIRDGVEFKDLGPDRVHSRESEAQKAKRRLEGLGYEVEIRKKSTG